jgi:heme/copper-type cytochrome/quinol oxidase subunit 3
MTAPTLPPLAVPRTLHDRPVGRRPPAWWGMLCLVATEASLFAVLLFSYFFIGAHSSVWPPGGPPRLTLTGINTVLLLSSSITMWWATSGVEAGQMGRLRAGLGLTLVLGIVFACVQRIEWAHLPFSPETHSYGSLFYTITGFHGAHVIVGLLMIAVVLLRAMLGHFSAQRHLAVRLTAIYWHFVDIVWLFVFTTLYLTPRM